MQCFLLYCVDVNYVECPDFQMAEVTVSHGLVLMKKMTSLPAVVLNMEETCGIKFFRVNYFSSRQTQS